MYNCLYKISKTKFHLCTCSMKANAGRRLRIQVQLPPLLGFSTPCRGLRRDDMNAALARPSLKEYILEVSSIANIVKCLILSTVHQHCLCSLPSLSECESLSVIMASMSTSDGNSRNSGKGNREVALQIIKSSAMLLKF